MLASKELSDLCVLLIREFYGQLPSRVFMALLTKGRSQLGRIAGVTGLGIRGARHGMILLIQQNLVFHHTNPDNGVTHYEANLDVAYSLVRTGKYIQLVQENTGEEAGNLVANILALGNATVEELVKLHCDEHKTLNGSAHMNGHHSVNGTDDLSRKWVDLAGNLIAAGILEPVNLRLFQSEHDLQNEIEQEVMKEFPSGVRAANKDKRDQLEEGVHKRLTQQRDNLKHAIESEYTDRGGFKRRKLDHGGPPNGNGFTATDRECRSGSHMNVGLTFLAYILGKCQLTVSKAQVPVRVNLEKCFVHLRNAKLVQYVDDAFGEVTAHVYSALLAALTKDVKQCSADLGTVTTLDVFEHVDSNVDLSDGIAKVDGEEIDQSRAETVHHDAPQVPEPYTAIEDVSSDEEDMVIESKISFMGQSSKSNGVHETKPRMTLKANGSCEDKVTTKVEQIQQLRQHLLLLAESQHHFVRHVGRHDHGTWTIDLVLLVREMKRRELDVYIEGTFGRRALRLTRVLRDVGKMDDKNLPTLALMDRADMQMKMTRMEMAGFLEVQEVPRDANRTAARTLFLWFFDEEQALARLLENTYKSMARCLQRLEVERRKAKEVLETAERTDVRGREEDMMNEQGLKNWREYLETECKLLTQVSRGDDLIGVLRDF